MERSDRILQYSAFLAALAGSVALCVGYGVLQREDSVRAATNNLGIYRLAAESEPSRYRNIALKQIALARTERRCALREHR